MRYVQVNSVPNGSTGSVMARIRDERLAAGDECWCMWGRGRAAESEHELNFGTRAGLYRDVLRTRIDGREGFHSKAATRRLLVALDRIDPDVVHLHNLHGYYVNVEMLFGWLKEHRCKVVWTLHDCWALTGHCAHFTYVGCDQWKSSSQGCGGECPQLSVYPKTRSKSSVSWSYERKRELFTSLPAERMTVVTPSEWLAGLVADSFLAKYPVEVRRNTVDTSVFRPTPSDFRERYGLEGKFVVLGVASPWTERKGLSDFVRLARVLDGSCAVVLVGLTRKQMRDLPKRIVGIERTESREELAAVYTAADVFFNPTREDNYPTVNLEAQACGTPVMTYDTGGCPETLRDIRSRIVHSLDEVLVDIREASDEA